MKNFDRVRALAESQFKKQEEPFSVSQKAHSGAQGGREAEDCPIESA
jgi:hypothetical protein